MKSSYIEQLRNMNLILDHFIPSFLGILRLDQGNLVKAFKLDLWAVDKFYVDCKLVLFVICVVNNSTVCQYMKPEVHTLFPS